MAEVDTGLPIPGSTGYRQPSIDPGIDFLYVGYGVRSIAYVGGTPGLGLTYARTLIESWSIGRQSYERNLWQGETIGIGFLGDNVEQATRWPFYGLGTCWGQVVLWL